MRKQNSEFLTAFTSEAAQNIKNTDCFGYVELDDYACYVIADGIDDQLEAMSAKLAVDTVITTFTEAPSMSRHMLKRCLLAANKALLEAKSKLTLKASIIIVLTDYEKLRYGQVGNIRLRVFRNGFPKEQTVDQSLAMELAGSGEISRDKVATHEERNNLYSYLGQVQGFKPVISKKIKLTNDDVVILYTREIWENIDEGEIKDVLADASNQPQELVDTVEDLLMSRQPKNLGKYTFAAIYINKVFQDPQRRKRRKKIILIGVILILACVVLSIVFYIRHQKKQNKIADMEQKYMDTIEYIQMDNYTKAEECCKDARSLAEELNDQKMQKELADYIKLIESVLAAQEKLDEGKYQEAQSAFRNALIRSRYADNVSDDYINEKLEATAGYLSVYDYITLGDSLTMSLKYNQAEKMYLQAKTLATNIYFDEGRTAALDALEKLYDKQKEQKEQQNQKKQDKLEKEDAATNFMAQGDTAFAQDNYDSAIVYYQSALQKYEALKDKAQQKMVKEKIRITKEKIVAQEEKEAEATEYMEQAGKKAETKDYTGAKKYYLLAKDIYAGLKNEDKLSEIERKMEIVEMKEEEQKNKSSETKQSKQTEKSDE